MSHIDDDIDEHIDDDDERGWPWIPSYLPEIVCGLLVGAWIFALKWQRPGDDFIIFIAAGQAVIWNNLLTVPHEIGHALMARAVGGKVLFVRIGSGPKLGVVRAFGTSWHLHLGIGGLSYMQDSIPYGRRFRLRNWLVVAAGPGTNLLLAACGVVLGGLWSVGDFLPKEGHAIAPTFVVANLAGALVALWPWTMYEDDEEFPTDGLQLLTIPFMSDEDAEREVEEHDEEVDPES